MKNKPIIINDRLVFPKIYSYPGNMEMVVETYNEIFDQLQIFLKPLEITHDNPLGWVLIELLNNAVRSPVSLSMNQCNQKKADVDLQNVNFYTSIIIEKIYRERPDEAVVDIDIIIKNKGEEAPDCINIMKELLSSDMNILTCESRFKLKGSITGNGGCGLFTSSRQIKNALNGSLSLLWEDGYYIFTIHFPEPLSTFNHH